MSSPILTCPKCNTKIVLEYCLVGVSIGYHCLECGHKWEPRKTKLENGSKVLFGRFFGTWLEFGNKEERKTCENTSGQLKKSG